MWKLIAAEVPSRADMIDCAEGVAYISLTNVGSCITRRRAHGCIRPNSQVKFLSKVIPCQQWAISAQFMRDVTLALYLTNKKRSSVTHVSVSMEI